MKLLADKRFDRIEALAALAEARGHTLLELAMGWLLAQPQVACIIAGATKPEQVESNAAAVGWHLDREDADRAAAIARGDG